MDSDMDRTVGMLLGIMLGLTMLIPGLAKLFVTTPAVFAGYLAWAGALALPLAWLVAISEVVCGASILAKWQLKYATIPPAIIMLVAAVSVYLPPFADGLKAALGGSATFLVHLTMAVGYLAFGVLNKK